MEFSLAKSSFEFGMDLVMDLDLCPFCIENNSNETTVESNLLPPAEENIMTYYICGPLLTVFIIMGLFGNSACIYVFLRPRASAGRRAGRLTQPIYVYLLSLAAWDLILLVSCFLLYNLPILSTTENGEPELLNHPFYHHSLSYFYYATNTAHSCANWVVVALGLERYFALCYPFKHRLFRDGRRRAIYIVCSISVAGILYSLPRLFETTIKTGEDGRPDADFNSLQQNFYYKTFYRVVGGMFLYSLGPFLCLLYVSVRVSAAVRQQRLFQAQTNRAQLSRRETFLNSTRQRQMSFTNKPNDNSCSYAINVMLIAVMVKLLFVHSLPTALDVAEAAMDESEFESKLITLLADVSILLVVVNSSCNFFVYFICSRQFRDEIRRVMFACCNALGKGAKGNESNWTSELTTGRESAPMLPYHRASELCWRDNA